MISFSGRHVAILFALILIVPLVSCSSMDTNPTDSATATASSPLKVPGPFNLNIPKEHSEIIDENSAGDSQFAGLYNTFELKATILNSQVREAVIRRQTEYYQWDSAQQSAEREKALQELNSQTDAFLSFATPDRKNDNLADKKSIWRIFLDVGGRRYVGQAKKDRRLIAELQSQFPYHTRWNTPYLLTFPVSTTAIETQPMKLTVTGPLGTRVLEFKPNSPGSVSPPQPMSQEPTPP